MDPAYRRHHRLCQAGAEDHGRGRAVRCAEIMSVQGLEVPKTGLTGAMDRKTNSHPLGGVFKRSTEHPAILLSTGRGGIIFAFDDKQRDQVRAAFVAISDLIG